MRRELVALVGERDLGKRAHEGIEASFGLFEQQHPGLVSFRWVPTGSIEVGSIEEVLGWASAIWCIPGSPYENTEGALEAIRYARERGMAFLGTCGGFQHALMEYCQNVLGRTAVHQELDGNAKQPLIARLSCSLVEVQGRVFSEEGSWYSETVGGTKSIEGFNCNYGLSPAFEPIFAGSKLEFVARDEQGQVRAFRLADHPFFVGTLFQPERKALTGALHPLVYQFLCKTVEPVRANVRGEENVQP